MSREIDNRELSEGLGARTSSPSSVDGGAQASDGASAPEHSQVPAAGDDVDPKAAQKVLRMGTAPIGKLLLEFAVPAIASVVLNALYNIIDSIFLGRAMGELGLAATTVAMPIMTIMIALSVLAGNGGNALCAILLGRGERERAEQSLGNTMSMIIIISIVVAVYATFFIDPLLVLLGATDETLPYARLFIQIILYGCILNNIAMGINNFIRTAGEPNRALWTMAIGTGVCIALNALFVLVFGWGVAGSASATVIGQGVSAVFVLHYFIKGRTAPFHLRRRCMRIDGQLCRRILALGLAPFALQAAAAVTQVVGNSILASLGAADPIGQDGALASIGVVVKVTMFVVFPIVGVAIAAQPILGFNVGAGKYRRVLAGLRDALVMGTAILVVLFVLIRLFPSQIVDMFGVSGDLRDFSVRALGIQTAFIPFIAVQIVGSNYFQATGQPLKSAVLSLTRQFIFLLPLELTAPHFIPLLLPQFTSLLGFCFTFPIADALSVVLCAVFLVHEVRKLKRKIHEQEGALEHV